VTVQNVYAATKNNFHTYQQFNLLILLSGNFNKFVNLAKHKTPSRWCRCPETCRSTYDIKNIIDIHCICCAFVGLDNKSVQNAW